MTTTNGRASRSGDAARGLAVALTLATGFSALVYEVAWERYLAILLGSHSEATAAVLGIFLAGLSYGYALFGRVSRRLVARSGPRGEPAHLLRTYGIVEIGIGLYAFAFPLVFAAVWSFSVHLPHRPEWLSFAVDVVLSAILILPPTILMGGTIPLLTQGLATGLADSTRFHALVYGSNTAGAFFGALAAAFFLIPRLGLTGAMLAMGAVNLAAGVAFVRLQPAGSGAGWATVESDPRAPVRGVRTFAVAVLLIGFAMMALQTTINRVVALAVGASPFTFATVVATFVLSIAVGSLVVSALDRIHPAVLPATQWCLVAYLLALERVVPDSGYWFHLLRSAFRDEPELFLPYRFAVFLALCSVLLLPLALSGAALPLVFHRLRNEVGELGRVAGRIYSQNTLGSLLGALLGGYALLFWLELHHVYRLAVLALAVAAAILTLRCLPRRRGLAVGGLLTALVVLVLLPAWSIPRVTAGAFRARQPRTGTFDGPGAFYEAFLGPRPERNILFHDDDPSATVTVVTTPGEGRAIIVNGKSDGNVPDENVTMVLIGLLPAMLAENAERAFVIGYGTGLTAGALATLDSVVEVVCAEISPGVIRAAPLFEALNLGAASNPKTRLLRADAYRSLLRSEGSFDVIASEPSNPWVSGVEMLFSREFLLAARARLSPGGVYAQWFHTYETDARTLALVLGTYRSVFDRVAVWSTMKGDVLLLGFRSADTEADLERLERRFGDPRFRSLLEWVGIDSLPALLAHERIPSGVIGEIDLPDEVHTLLHPRLNHRAARAFFAGKAAELPVTVHRPAAEAGARSSLLGRLLRERRVVLTDGDWVEIAEQGCRIDPRVCAVFLARWRHERGESAELTDAIAQARRSTAGAPALADEELGRLLVLFGENPPEGADYDTAYGLLETFTLSYSHAFPFRSEPLRAAWRRCASDPRCAQRLPLVESLGMDALNQGERPNRRT